MELNKMPISLMNKVKRFKYTLFNTGLGTRSVFKVENTRLQNDVILWTYRELIKNLPMLRHLKTDEILALVGLFNRQYFLRLDYLIKKGEEGNEMFYLAKGSVNIIVNDNLQLTKHGPTYFGEIALVLQTKRLADVISNEFCVVEALLKDDLTTVCQSFYGMYSRMLSAISLKEVFKDNAMGSLTHYPLFKNAEKQDLEQIHNCIHECSLEKDEVA